MGQRIRKRLSRAISGVSATRRSGRRRSEGVKWGDKKIAAGERDVRRWQDVAEDVEGEKEASKAACNKKIVAAEAKAENRKETNDSNE